MALIDHKITKVMRIKGFEVLNNALNCCADHIGPGVMNASFKAPHSHFWPDTMKCIYSLIYQLVSMDKKQGPLAESLCI